MSIPRRILTDRIVLCHLMCYFVLLMTTAGCMLGHGVTDFRGTVFDEDNMPVLGADVTVLSDPDNKKSLLTPLTIQTKTGGKFSIRRSHAPVEGGIILKVEMKGYEAYRKRYEAGDVYANLYIVLKKKKPEPNEESKDTVE